MKKFLLFLCIPIFLVGMVTAGQATTVGYSIDLFGNTNVPTIRLTNTSSIADITEFTMTIGNTTKNFDFVNSISQGSVDGYTRITPDTSNNGVRSNFINFTFSGFDPTEVFQFNADIDRDNANTVENYTSVLFNNGSFDNSLITVLFSDNSSLSGYLPDFTNTPYTFEQSISDNGISPTPEPTTMLLLGSGLIGLAGFRRRLKK